jgi:putative membrane protein
MPWPLGFGLLAYFLCIFIVTMLVYNNFTFEVDNDGLKIEQGIIHRLHVSVPFEQIQNVNIERSLSDRLLGLSRISIETAGQASTPTNGSITKSRSEAYLPGLHLKEAEIIHDLLIDGADGVMGG